MKSKFVIINGEEYCLKQMTTETINDFTILFNATKKQKVSPEYFLRKFSNCPSAEFYFGFLLYKEKMAVAHCGAIPIVSVMNGENIIIGHVGDTVTHANFQNKSLNKFLTNHLIEFCSQKNIDFLFRFPNKVNSAIVKDKYNWIQCGNLVTISVKMQSLLLFKILTKLKFIDFYETLFKVFLRTFYKETFNPDYIEYKDKLIIPRNINYLKYKKYNNSYCLEFTNKLYIWVKIDDGLVIGDTNAKNDDEASLIVNKIKTLCFWGGLHKCKFVFSSEHPAYKLFKGFGVVETGNPIMVKPIKEKSLYEHVILNGSDQNTF